MKKEYLTLEDLALMVQKGFERTDKNIKNLRKDLQAGFNKVESSINLLNQGEEDIKLRLDSVTYRFEMKELETRVRRLERRMQKDRWSQASS